MFYLQSADRGTAADEIFGEIVRRYQARIVSWCSRFVRDGTCGMDLAQEVFLKAYRYRFSFRGDSRLSTWLYAIARNHCLNAMQKRAADPLSRTEGFPPSLADSGPHAHARAERMQAFERLWIVVDQTLTEMEKRVLALHYGHELTLEAITRSCRLSNPSGAKAYIVNAKRKLKVALANRNRASARSCAA